MDGIEPFRCSPSMKIHRESYFNGKPAAFNGLDLSSREVKYVGSESNLRENSKIHAACIL